MLGGISLSFVEPHEYQERIRPANVQITPTTRGIFTATLAQFNLHHLTLQQGTQSLPTASRSELHKSRNAILFHAGPVGPGIKVDSSDLAPDSLVLGAPAEEHFFHVPANTAWSTLTVPPEIYAMARATLLGRDAAAIPSSIFRPPQSALNRLRTLHQRIVGLVRAGKDHGLHPESAKAAEHALLVALVDCLAGAGDIMVARVGSRNSTAVMRKLHELLETNDGLPLYMMDVCADLGVSRRTLHTACVEHLGLSPHRFFLLRRMQLARQALLAADQRATTVTQIATSLGFWELGRFAVNYRQLFGESPSATLGRRRR
ncbi:MAG: helix-turn-helix domain-containing protein [Acetobacteraceae bacterium]